jgi:hypothetical protein
MCVGIVMSVEQSLTKSSKRSSELGTLRPTKLDHMKDLQVTGWHLLCVHKLSAKHVERRHESHKLVP